MSYTYSFSSTTSPNLDTLRMSAQLRQQTLSFYSSGALRANRPGPRPKAPTAISIPLIRGGGRRLVGGINEQEAIEAFTKSRMRFAAGLPNSNIDSSNSNNNQLKKHKLAT